MLGRIFRVDEMFKGRSGSLGCKSGASKMERLKQEPEMAAPAPAAPCDINLNSLEDARKLVNQLRQRTRAQAQHILNLRRICLRGESMIGNVYYEKSEQLRYLSARLLLVQARLIKKQKDITAMLTLRDNIIHRQRIIIESLTNRLNDNGLELPKSELSEIDTTLHDMDSLNDSDSAVVMEEIDTEAVFNLPRMQQTTSNGITVARSISDAIDPSLKYTSLRRTSGFLRRPEILETVYSVEEDADESPSPESKSEADKKRDAFASKGKSPANVETEEENTQKDRSVEEKVYDVPSWRYGKGSKDCTENDKDKPKASTSQVKTYNRVMSNHRSVTKPKDVKYKRINKAKSKSLEELRGRLKNWVEQGTKLTGLTFEHAQSYA